MAQPTTPVRWYDKPARVLLLLFLFFPVGLYGLWKSSRIAMLWKVLGTVLIAAWVIFIAQLPPPPKDNTVATQVAAEQPTVEQPAAEQPEKLEVISSTDLAARYAENEVRADQEFKGQRINVAGVVTGIKKDMFDKIYIMLATDNEFLPTWCYLDDEDAAAALQNGQQIIVRGKCQGMSVGSVTLKDCELIRK